MLPVLISYGDRKKIGILMVLIALQSSPMQTTTVTNKLLVYVTRSGKRYISAQKFEIELLVQFESA